MPTPLSTGDPAPLSGLQARCGLLVSVRSAIEAEAAVAGGACVIDVKEPAAGPLGAAEAGVVSEVVRRVAGRRPVTAAAGELVEIDSLAPYSAAGVQIVKVGLSQMAGADWPRRLHEVRSTFEAPAVAPVAYADHLQAGAPSLADVVDHAAGEGFRWVVIDTFDKRAGCLFDHLPVSECYSLVDHAHASGLRVVLAGSLSEDAFESAVETGADLVGVRGAACRGGRLGAVEAHLVHALSAVVASAKKP